MEYVLERLHDEGRVLLVGPLFALVGVLLLVATVVKVVRARRTRAHEVRATGIVVGWEDRPGRRGGTLHFPRVRFFDFDGTEYEITASVGTSFRTVTVGHSVKLRFEPGKPGEADMDTWLTRWFEILVFLFMGCGFSFLGPVLTLVFWL